MGGNLDRNGFASGERGGWYGEPDWDAPWHCNHIDLPTNARCENCRHFCRHDGRGRGRCFSAEVGENLIKRPEDRCNAWQVAEGWLERSAQAESAWKPTEPWLPVFDGVNR